MPNSNPNTQIASRDENDDFRTLRKQTQDGTLLIPSAGLRFVTDLGDAAGSTVATVDTSGNFLGGTPQGIYVGNYGVWDPTGVTDSTAALNAAIQAALAMVSGLNYGCTILLGRGTFLISDTVLVNEAIGIWLVGDGIGATTLISSGMAGLPIVQLRNASYCGVVGMTILGEAAHKPMAGIEIRRESGHAGGYGSTKNVVMDVKLGNDASYLMGKGISISGDLDANNDFHKFIRVDSASATEADCGIDNTQSVGQSFINCNFNGASITSKHGVWVAATRDRAGDDAAISPNPPGGKFNWRGGSCGGHSVSDFYVGGEGPGVNSIDDCNSEDSYRFLDSAFLPGVASLIILKNIRYGSNSLQAVDNLAFKWGFGGCFVMQDCRLDQDGAGLFAKVSLQAIAPLVSIITGNQWNQDGSDLQSMIVKNIIPPSGAYPGGSYISTESNLYASAAGYFKWRGNVAATTLTATATWDPADTANDAFASTTVPVTGAAVGDQVALGFSIAVPAGVLLVGAVTSADTVTATLFNKSGGNVNLTSGTLTATVTKQPVP